MNWFKNAVTTPLANVASAAAATTKMILGTALSKTTPVAPPAPLTVAPAPAASSSTPLPPSLKRIRYDDDANAPPAPLTVAPAPAASSLKRKKPYDVNAPAASSLKRKKDNSADKELEISLKENFLKENELETAAKKLFIKEEEELLKRLKTEADTSQHTVSEISHKRTQNVAMIAEKLFQTKSPESPSIPIFQDYTRKQIADFFSTQIPPDAKSVLDNFDKLSPDSQKEILDFIILKYKAVRLNSPNDEGSPAHDVYNQLEIKSLSLDSSSPLDSSSATALLVCKVKPCAPDSSDWCCKIVSDSTSKFSNIAKLIETQDLPFVTAHPRVQTMMEICGSTDPNIRVQASVGKVADAGEGVDKDPQGFAEPFPSVIIGEQKIIYSIGPILDAESVLGRALIMIRIHNYKTRHYPNGIYFWVYPSFSEGGPNRVFLTIGNGQFMKGPDYTLTTFILDLLQVHINSYYKKHFVDKQGAFSPTILDNQQRVVCFFGGMIHLQTQWVHDLIEGRGLNMSEKPIIPALATFNRHCYKFVRSLHMQDWLSFGIPNVNTSYGYSHDSSSSATPILSATPRFLADEFLRQNRENQQDKTTTYSFPLSCCLTTIFHKYRNSKDVDNFFDLFKRWTDTRFVQGCSIVHGVSPVVCVVVGTSTNLAGMKYNTFLKHLAPMEFVKKIESLRLVAPIVTPDPGKPFTMSTRTGRNTILVKELTQDLERKERLITETCLMVVDLDPVAGKIVKFQEEKQRSITDDERAIIIFDTLPIALQNTIKTICREVFVVKEHPPAQLSPGQIKVQQCFKNFLGLGHDTDITKFNGLLLGIINPSIQVSTDRKHIIIIKDSPLYRLIRTLDSGMYRHLLMSSMLDEYTGMTSYPLDITGNDTHLNPRVRCAFLNSEGQYVEIRVKTDDMDSLGNCDFSSIFKDPSFDPYIFSATRNSMTFPDTTLQEYISYPKRVNANTAQIHAKIPVKVHNKMFLVRLIFYTSKGAIQIVVCVSSTICVASPVGEDPYCPFGVDVQFNVVSIGPLRVDDKGSMSTDATILATMCDYLSLGCMGAAKKGEYSKTAGYQQFLDYFDDYFRTIMTECFTYVSAYISPFNSGKDLIMKHFGRVFKDFGDNDISGAIRQKWDWFTYLQKVQPKVCTKDPEDRLLTQEMLKEAITSGRRNMQVVVQTLFDPILGQLDKSTLEEETGDGSSQGTSYSLSQGMSSEFTEKDTQSSHDSSSSGESWKQQYTSDSDGGTNKKTRKYIGNRKNKTKSKTKMKTIRRIINGNMRTRKNTHHVPRTKTMKIKSRKFPKRIYLYSSPRKAQKKAYKYLGKTAKLYPASNPAKKYMIYDPKNNKWVNFGQMGYEDYTKHRDKTRRKNYLTRTKGMLGDWKNNKYSANRLSRSILW